MSTRRRKMLHTKRSTIFSQVACLAVAAERRTVVECNNLQMFDSKLILPVG